MPTTSTATLITIPFSHYCEKARWALNYGGVSYREEAHVPGFHALATRRARAQRTVPVLLVDGRVIGDSTDILRHVDASVESAKKLYPTDAAARREVDALEDTFDDKLGPHLRRLLYFHLLPNRALTLDLMDRGAPRGERAVLHAVFPLLRLLMRRSMRIDAAGAARSKDALYRVFDDVNARLSDGRPYLVGDRFSAADLTFASLAVPAIVPPEYRIHIPPLDALPAEASKIISELRATPAATYVRRMYRDHRRPTRHAESPS